MMPLGTSSQLPPWELVDRLAPAAAPSAPHTPPPEPAVELEPEPAAVRTPDLPLPPEVREEAAPVGDETILVLQPEETELESLELEAVTPPAEPELPLVSRRTTGAALPRPSLSAGWPAPPVEDEPEEPEQKIAILTEEDTEAPVIGEDTDSHYVVVAPARRGTETTPVRAVPARPRRSSAMLFGMAAVAVIAAGGLLYFLFAPGRNVSSGDTRSSSVLETRPGASGGDSGVAGAVPSAASPAVPERVATGAGGASPAAGTSEDSTLHAAELSASGGTARGEAEQVQAPKTGGAPSEAPAESVDATAGSPSGSSATANGATASVASSSGGSAGAASGPGGPAASAGGPGAPAGGPGAQGTPTAPATAPSDAATASTGARAPQSVAKAPPATAPASGAASEDPARKAAAPTTGRVSILSRPPGATVLIDGQDRGRTPVNVTGLALGSHSVKLTKPGFAAAETTLAINSPDAGRVSLSLEPTAPAQSGAALTLLVTSNEIGAEVFLDNSSAGTAPLTLTLPAGKHTIKVAPKDKPEKIDTITVPGDVAPGQRERRHFQF
jgi:Meckel syndrome type 1 protein